MTLPDKIELTELERATLDANVAQLALAETTLKLARLEAQNATQAVQAAHKAWVDKIISRVGISAETFRDSYKPGENGVFVRVENTQPNPVEKGPDNGNQQHQGAES